MLKLGILGYGKMGKAIDQLAESQGIEVVWRINRSNIQERTESLISTADVVIEFSRPEAAYENVMACLEARVPVVSGTTGWAEGLEQAKHYCTKNNGALLWASNFSIGVNLFFALNRYLAQLMNGSDAYLPSLTETHHIHKLDAPSGTAITLASDLLTGAPRIKAYQLLDSSKNTNTPKDILPIRAERIGEVPGTHTIHWTSGVDEITIEHRADSREGFALGALAAAKWLRGKQGVFNMNQVLNIK